MAKIYSEYIEGEKNKSRVIAEVRPEILKKRFLEVYSQTANIQKACHILGMVRRTPYAWKRDDPEFAKAFEEADALALEALEDEANRRAMYGVSKPIVQNGKIITYVQEYSDTLLIVLLKARAPHKYKERFSGELMGADGRPLIPENKVVHIHSNVPLAENEDDINEKMIYLPESAYKDIPIPEPITNVSENSERQLSDEDEELLGSI